MDERIESPSDILPAVLDYQGPDRVVSSMEFVELMKPKVAKPVLTSGISELDEALKGFQPGEVTVISGPTSMGKTLLADTLIRYMRQQIHYSLFFTFEVTAETIALSHNSPDSVVFLPLQHVGNDLEWLRWRCLEAKMKYNCESVVIDHMHHLVDLSGQQNMSLEIGRVMRFLKAEIALRMNLAVFLVCHIGKIDLKNEPTIGDLRDSSFIGQEADNVLMLWRRKDKDVDGKNLDSMTQGLATIKIEKARRSGAMGIKILVKKKGLLLVESKDEPIRLKKVRAVAPVEPTQESWLNE